MLKKLFPISYAVKGLGSFILRLLVYLVLPSVVAWVASLVSGIPVVGWVVGIVAGLMGLYSFIGIILLILKALKVIK